MIKPIHPVFKNPGMLRLATIKRVDTSLMTAYISFFESVVGTDDSTNYPAQLPISYLSAGGGFIGGYVAEGTPVIVGQAEGSSQYFIVAFLARDPASRSSIARKNINIPDFVKGELYIQANENNNIYFNNDSIVIGEENNSITIDTTRNIYLNSFDYNYNITQATKEITGAIKRDRKPNANFATFLRDVDPAFDDVLKPIGMDPVADVRYSSSSNSTRNPSRIEKREILYEYEIDYDVKSNDIETNYYKSDTFQIVPGLVSRRESRADVLSLSLTSPNYLMESVKGTLVDIYGNIMDLNRSRIQIGLPNDPISVSKIKSTINETNSYKNVYEQIKRSERNSIVIHLEMNARKELGNSGFPDVNDTSNYTRARSRFFFDMDKEGQFRLNVPASSETGNIPLLTRYENFSTVYPGTTSENITDTDHLVFNSEYKDILQESFIGDNQVVSLQNENGGNTGPIDRFSKTNIKHGTVYHNISQVCSTLQAGSGFYTPVEYIPTTSLGRGLIAGIAPIINSSITISGQNANAGGRSGSLNFDGSIEINIGANTVDRQSLWLDTQGGAVVSLGRDLNNNSLAANFDGNVMLQIGGNTPSVDTRFPVQTTQWASGVFECRVFNSNNTNGHHEMTVIRVDNEGVSVTTPGRVMYYSNGDMVFRTAGSLILDGEDVVINGRRVVKDPGKGAIR